MATNFPTWMLRHSIPRNSPADSVSIIKIRIHSSRMRTARLNGHLGGEGWECVPLVQMGGGGDLPLGLGEGVSASGSWGGGLSASGLEGVCLCLCLCLCTPRPDTSWADIPPAKCMLGYAPMCTEWLTDRCKTITFPQLRLREVTMIHYCLHLQ